MKNNLVKLMRISAVVLLTILAAQNAINAQDKGASLQSANRLVGAWETTVTFRNCETGEPLGAPVNGVSSYNEGGTMTEFAANPTTPYRTPGHGIWVSNIGGSYSMKFSFLPLTPAGAPIGRMRVSQEIELPRFSDEFTSSGSFVLTNFSGVVLATGCSTATAERLTL